MEVQFEPESYYHIFNHAVGTEDLFRSDGNYQYFLNKYSQYVFPVCGTMAYCLLPNHFHMLIQTRSLDEINK